MFVKHLQQGVPSVPLTSFISTNTAYLNDCEPDLLFAQGVNSLGNRGDVLVCFSTSGNSANVLYAAKLAKAKGLTVVSFTGESGGKLKYLSDVFAECAFVGYAFDTRIPFILISYDLSVRRKRAFA